MNFRYLKQYSYLLVNLCLIILLVPVVGMASIELSKSLGLRSVPIPVVGTGSMYPSLFWSTKEGGPENEDALVVQEYRTTPHLYPRFRGITFLGKTYFKKTVGYGDMVAFKNGKTSSILTEEKRDPNSGFIKRVIGVPGDTIELRDGFVYENGTLLSEPYITSPRSTYGGTQIKDCQKLTIQTGEYFVLGDNRKVSSDSRFELGLIKEEDITALLPYSQQQIYLSLWRDPSHDDELLGKSTLDPQEFLGLVNSLRATKDLSPLSLHPKLGKSTQLRGTKLLQDKDSNYTLKDSLASVDYNNIIIGEFVSHGRFTSQELLENLLYHPSTANQILHADYSDLGLSSVNREVDGCPSQIIVGHLGGYIPASYDQSVIDGWLALRSNLVEILPSWEDAQGYNSVDQSLLVQLLNILRRRLSLSEEIIKTMEQRAWLTTDQQQRITSDEDDARQAEILSKQLNGD